MKDLAPSDLAVRSFAGDGSDHNVKKVLYFWVVDWLCDKAGEHHFGFLLTVFEAQPSRRLGQHRQQENCTNCKRALETERESPADRIVRDVREAKVHPVGQDKTEDEERQLYRYQFAAERGLAGLALEHGYCCSVDADA